MGLVGEWGGDMLNRCKKGCAPWLVTFSVNVFGSVCQGGFSYSVCVYRLCILLLRVFVYVFRVHFFKTLARKG